MLEHNAKVILCSHLGKPKGEIKPNLTLRPVAERLSEYLGFEVKFATDIVGESAKKLANELEPGKAILLENVRFDPREEANDKEFSKELADLAEIYVMMHLELHIELIVLQLVLLSFYQQFVDF